MGGRGTPDLLVTLGLKVRAARARAGLTQEEAAAASAIDVKRWQRIELGTVNATMRTLDRIASALDTTVWQMLCSNTK